MSIEPIWYKVYLSQMLENTNMIENKSRVFLGGWGHLLVMLIEILANPYQSIIPSIWSSRTTYNNIPQQLYVNAYPGRILKW